MNLKKKKVNEGEVKKRNKALKRNREVRDGSWQGTLPTKHKDSREKVRNARIYGPKAEDDPREVVYNQGKKRKTYSKALNSLGDDPELKSSLKDIYRKDLQKNKPKLP